MKRIAIIILIVLALILAWFGGYNRGVEHVLLDSELWIVDFDEPEDHLHDITVYISIDDQVHEHGCYIG